MLALRHPRHEADGRLDFKYGWARNQAAGTPAVSGETADLITFTATYGYRGLRGARPKPHVPDPYFRLRMESELTRPAVTATQPRAFHHLEMTDTAGVLFTVAMKLRLRGGGGVRKELLAPGDDGRWRPVVEAGATLDPVAAATVGDLPIRLEGFADYTFVDPSGVREHQLRASAKLTAPLLPLLFLSVGVDAFAVQRENLGWAASYDTTIGLRLHLDAALQALSTEPRKVAGQRSSDRATRNGRSAGVPKAVFWTSTIRGSRKALRRAGIAGCRGQDICFGRLGNDNVSARVASARGPLRASRPSCRARMIRLGCSCRSLHPPIDAAPRAVALLASAVPRVHEVCRSTPVVQAGGSLAGKDSLPASSTTSSSRARSPSAGTSANSSVVSRAFGTAVSLGSSCSIVRRSP